ncbi:hypothetical protein JL722_6905 [Aureococcus anophagefferens]|nr:hypothetical protein JL722_6905 [Aureococcus anophagefferens]
MEQVAAVAAREEAVAMEEEDAPVDADQRMPDKDDVAAREREEPEAQETKEETPPNGHAAPAPAACDDLNPEEAAAPVPAVVAEAEAPRDGAESDSDGSYDGEDYGRFGFRGESYEVVLAEPRLGMTLENVLEQTVVHDVDAGGAAAAAGMRRGALLVAIGGESTFGLLHDEVIDRLRQPRRPLVLTISSPPPPPSLKAPIATPPKSPDAAAARYFGDVDDDDDESDDTDDESAKLRRPKPYAAAAATVLKVVVRLAAAGCGERARARTGAAAGAAAASAAAAVNAAAACCAVAPAAHGALPERLRPSCAPR